METAHSGLDDISRVNLGAAMNGDVESMDVLEESEDATNLSDREGEDHGLATGDLDAEKAPLSEPPNGLINGQKCGLVTPWRCVQTLMWLTPILIRYIATVTPHVHHCGGDHRTEPPSATLAASI